MVESKCMKESDLKVCCCGCEYQTPLFKSPCNQDEYVKGSIMDLVGYACIVKGDGRGIFMDRQHSMCEEYKGKL